MSQRAVPPFLRSSRDLTLLAVLPMFLISTACGGAFAETVEEEPFPGAPVVDDAQIIEAEAETALNTRLTDYWDENGTAIVVHSADSLGGETIEDYAHELHNSWGIGSAQTGRGILIVIAPNEGLTRISIGCGLESVLTNETSQMIVNTALVPNFRDGQWVQGVNEGIDDIEALLASSEVEPGPTTPFCIEAMKQAA